MVIKLWSSGKHSVRESDQKSWSSVRRGIKNHSVRSREGIEKLACIVDHWSFFRYVRYQAPFPRLFIQTARAKNRSLWKIMTLNKLVLMRKIIIALNGKFSEQRTWYWTCGSKENIKKMWFTRKKSTHKEENVTCRWKSSGKRVSSPYVPKTRTSTAQMNVDCRCVRSWSSLINTWQKLSSLLRRYSARISVH